MLASLTDFLQPLNIAELNDDEGYSHSQLGAYIAAYTAEGLPDIENIDIVIVGCNESRGETPLPTQQHAPNAIRKQLYALHYWHKTVKIADFGNIVTCPTIKDSHALLKTVVSELVQLNKKVIILGGSHDLSLAQYQAYESHSQAINVACTDAYINLDMDSAMPANNFLMPLLTDEPNYVKHYAHIGFQSYLVNPQMLETIDKLRFDCFSLGKTVVNIDEVEPALRAANMYSFDVCALQYAHAPAQYAHPNGFDGVQACTLMQYAGMATHLTSMGIYGFNADNDLRDLTAKQISQMIWYFIDGVFKGKLESEVQANDNNFKEFTLAFADIDTHFLQSKQTGRWWMKAHDGKYIPCSKNDYMLACNNEIPDRWLRYVERS